jgi:predicted nucleic acid-binding protein
LSKVLLDTSGYSGLANKNPRLVQALEEAEAIFISAVVLGELLAGFRKGSRYEKNQKLLQEFLEKEAVEILAIDEETALRYAVIQHSLWTAGTPIPTNDIWIAASAMQYGLRILTTDAHYQSVSQVMVDYFD